ncbi:hypothetical protein G3M74_22705 [Paenibacillus polymyxa]|nr:hypothetical protein [Paenibacillus polymyxa]
MTLLTVSEQLFKVEPDLFIKEHISQLLIEQFNKSHKTETPQGLVAFCFYFDHAFVIVSTSKGEIYSYQRVLYNDMLPDSFLQSLYLSYYKVPFHWQKWLTDSRLELIRKEIAQGLNFNRLILNENSNTDLFNWKWKSHNITLQMNHSFVFNDIKIN